MRKRERVTRLVFVSLLVFISAAASAQTLDFTISPTQLNLNDVENFITLRGVTPGSDSTLVTYQLGDTQITIPPQLDPDHPSELLATWIPVGVAITEGAWSITADATDIDGTVRHYGPAVLNVVAVGTGGGGTDVLQLPEIVLGEAESSSGGHVTFDVGSAACDHPSGSLFALGVTSVHCSAGGSSGTFSVIVTDTTAPVLTVPASFSTLSHTPTYAVSAADNLDGDLPASSIVCAPDSGATFPDGQTEVRCVAIDGHANYGYGSFVVTVITVPILHLPDDIVTEATSAAGAAVTYSATAEGGTIQCTPPSGSTFALGVTTVNCSATNSAGTSSGSFTITVRDTTPPRIVDIDGTPREVLWPNNHKMQNTTIIVTATDLVDPHPHAQIVSVTSDQPVNDGGDGDTAPDWLITGDLTVQLRSERSYGLDRHYTITVAVTDASGNTSTGTLIIAVHP